MAYLVGGRELCSEFWQIQVQTYLTSKRLIKCFGFSIT